MKTKKITFEKLLEQIEPSLSNQIKEWNAFKSHAKSRDDAQTEHAAIIESGGEHHALTKAKSQIEISDRQWQKSLTEAKRWTANSINISHVAIRALAKFFADTYEQKLFEAADAILPFVANKHEAREAARHLSGIKALEQSEFNADGSPNPGRLLKSIYDGFGGWRPFDETTADGKIDVSRMIRDRPEKSVNAIKEVIGHLKAAIKAGSKPVSTEVETREETVEEEREMAEA